ncbi:hypothetical protein, partial [Nocardia cyriacigeorgica]|uniref:hypothetical protein n=1 Tax=Nocardia cyriacigeorgica TaxID=135487 RepID=UPI003CC7F03F
MMSPQCGGHPSTSTPGNDESETIAIKQVFGEHAGDRGRPGELLGATPGGGATTGRRQGQHFGDGVG